MRKTTHYRNISETNLLSNDHWAFEQPVWDTEKCIRCGLCYLFCPDSAIFQKTDGYYEVKGEYCKGCGICTSVCLMDCISLKQIKKRPAWIRQF